MSTPSQIPCTVRRSERARGVWAWLKVFMRDANPMTAG
ncbi:MAG: hypothetical protein IMHGJWDQ_001329, partial [Candidatus Fervidibacter sp.]